jgi:hypothetical protein
MGTISFQLPATLPASALQELEWACVAGGPDNMPWPTEVRVEGDRLLLRRIVDDSGYLAVPWEIHDAGLLMTSSSTLMERPQPYSLQVELARGKVNQVRSQLADWKAAGLAVTPDLEDRVRQATLAFGRAVTQPPSDLVGALAQTALVMASLAGRELVEAYVRQVFAIRHERQEKLDTAFGCRLGARVPQGPAADAVRATCNSVAVPLAWHIVEPGEGRHFWEPHDALISWALNQGLSVTAGPLIDFSSSRLPDWLWQWQGDLAHLADLMCAYVETAVQRYQDRVRRWHLTSASNTARLLGLREDELLWLTVRLIEVVRQINPALELIVGISQPWGEYLAAAEQNHSPFIFADTLIRTGVNLAALDLELVMGVTPRGSYCRDLLETSRLLDLYSLLGVPLRVTLGYPSAREPDAQADPEMRVAAGRWRDGHTPEVQASWAADFAALTSAKLYVQGVHWVHLSDAETHQFPHCGLLDAAGQPKPAVELLHRLRQVHFR